MLLFHPTSDTETNAPSPYPVFAVLIPVPMANKMAPQRSYFTRPANVVNEDTNGARHGGSAKVRLAIAAFRFNWARNARCK